LEKEERAISLDRNPANTWLQRDVDLQPLLGHILLAEQLPPASAPVMADLAVGNPLVLRSALPDAFLLPPALITQKAI